MSPNVFCIRGTVICLLSMLYCITSTENCNPIRGLLLLGLVAAAVSSTCQSWQASRLMQNPQNPRQPQPSPFNFS